MQSLSDLSLCSFWQTAFRLVPLPRCTLCMPPSHMRQEMHIHKEFVRLSGITQSCAMLQGIVISCCLICAVLFCSAAWDYILQYWTAFAPHVMPPAERDLLLPGTELVCALYMTWFWSEPHSS